MVTERVIRKIGLRDTYYGGPPDSTRHETPSLTWFDYHWKKDKAVWLDNFSGAGAIVSTPQDLGVFIHALFAGRLISPESLDIMKTQVDYYGMGMFGYGTAEHPGYGHNGKTEGFASSLSYYPENKLSIAYCTSGEVYSKNLIVDDVYKICFGLPVEIPGFNPIPLPMDQLQAYTGTYRSADSSFEVIATMKENQLVLETHGQQFKLDPLTDSHFMCAQFGFFFDFAKNGKLMITDVESVYETEKVKGLK